MPLRFLPRTLTAKCRRLIDAHHAIRGYAQLPDLLWHAETRELIATNEDLRSIFRQASTTRSAKEANESYVLLMSVIMALEVLASDFEGWGQRFPRAKHQAADIVERHLESSRTRVLDIYVSGAARRPRIRGAAA